MLNRYLSKLDVYIHASIAAALMMLACASCALGLRGTVTGPWLIAMVASGVGIVAMWCSFESWPGERLKDTKRFEKIFDAIEKYQGFRSDRTKKLAGVMLWKAMRSGLIFYAVWSALGLVTGLPAFFKIFVSIGFSVSFGYFGIMSSLAAGWTLTTLAHFVVQKRLGFDFADQMDRVEFMSRWHSGSVELSWWWGLAVVAAVPAWIAVGGICCLIGSKLSEELKENIERRETQRRIDRRRKRRSEAPKNLDDDLVRMAAEVSEAAKQRLAAIAKGGEVPIDDGISMLAFNGGERESEGVSKVRQDTLGAMATRWLNMIRNIAESEGLGIELQSKARQGFDRVIIAMTEEMRSFLLSGRFAGGDVILAYYDKLMLVQKKVGGSSDGDVVMAVPDSRPMAVDDDDGDVFDEDDAPSYAPALTESSFSQPTLTAEESAAEETRVDLPVATALSSPAPEESEATLNDIAPVLMQRRRSGLELGLDAMTAMVERANAATSSESTDGGSKSDPLPVTDQASGDAPAAVRFVDVGDAMIDGDDEEGSVVERRDEAATDVVTVEAGPVAHAIEAEAPAAVATVVEPIIEEAPQSDDGASPVAAEPVVERGEGDETAIADAAPVVNEAEIAAEEEGDVVSIELRNDVLQIATGGFDQAFVRRTAGQFESAEQVSRILGVAESLVREKFEQYNVLVRGVQEERSLAAALEMNVDVEKVRGLIEKLKAGIWVADPALMERADEYVIEKDREELAQREVAEADAREQEAADAFAREEAARAEEAAQEAARREALRPRICSFILLDQLTDEVLDEGAEMFPTVEDLAEAASMQVQFVQERFDRFNARRAARLAVQALRMATEAEDRAEVEQLLLDTASFENYPGAEGVIGTAKSWLEFVRNRDKVAGVSDHGVVWSTPKPDKQLAAARRKVLRHMMNVSEEQGRLIDEDLVGAVELVASMRLVASNKLAPESMKAAYMDAQIRAADIAASILAMDEDVLRYVDAVFPTSLRMADKNGLETLSAIVDDRPEGGISVPAAAPARVAATVREPAMAGGDDRPARPVAIFDLDAAEEANDPTRPEAIAALEPEVYVSKLIQANPNRAENGAMLRHFDRKVKPLILDGENAIEMSVGGLAITLNGHTMAVVLGNYALAPVFYDEKTDIVHAILGKEDPVSTRGVAFKQFIENAETRLTYNAERPKAEAVLFASAWIDPIGEATFRR